MTPNELFQSGRINDAIQALSAELRNFPSDSVRRTFLFEMLCFTGDYDRAAKHLQLLVPENEDRHLESLLYRAAMQAERTRQEMFDRKEYPRAGGGHDESHPPISGALNGKPFSSLVDDDPRIGARLEVIAGDSYLWIPFEHLKSVEVEPPRRLRDLLWANAVVQSGPAFEGRNLGQVLLPVLAPLSWRHADDAVRLGRTTVWEEDADDQSIPFGQKILVVDGEEVPLLEVRRLEIEPVDNGRS